jgi:competence protein ComEC
MFRGRALAWLAGGFLAGAAAARVTDAAPALLALAVLSALIIRRAFPLPILLLGIALGGLRQEWAETRERTPAGGDRIEGVVQGPPRITRTLEDPDGEAGADGSFVVDRVQVRFFGRAISLLGGERVVVRGELRRPRPATNPGQFDYASFLDRQGIDAVMTMEELQVLEGPSLAGRARGWARSLLDRGMRPATASFLGAIVLGRREAVDDELIDRFQKSGTAHLLAISGQNLVIVLVSLWTVLTLLGIRGRPLSLLLLGLLGVYVLLTGMQVSVVRSYVMIAVFLGADLVWRKRDAVSALAASALLICAVDPAQVADLGFQLSFVAVLGLSFVAPIFHGLSDAPGWIGNRLRLAIGVSVAAWLATAPLILEHFNLLTPGIVVANLALVPLMSIEFMIGLVHLVLAPLGAGAASGWAADVTFDLIRGAAGLVTRIPFSHAYGSLPGPLLIAAYYAGLAGWTAWCRRRPSTWRPYLALALAVPLGLTAPLRHRAPEGLFLAVLDVGRGSCAYLEWPDGRNAVVDCGSLNARDPGATIAAKYLWHRGVTRLDTLVLSHPDLDHVNGARTLLERFQVRRLLVTRAFRDARWPEGVEVVTAERVGDPVRWGDFEILGPPVWEKFGREAPPNETSLVLRTGGVLLPGDVEERGVEELLTLPDLRARVLVLPHHAKFHRRHEEFARRVGAQVTIASAPEGYYSPRVAAALDPPPLITGREGAIELEILPDVVRRRAR